MHVPPRLGRASFTSAAAMPKAATTTTTTTTTTTNTTPPAAAVTAATAALTPAPQALQLLPAHPRQEPRRPNTAPLPPSATDRPAPPRPPSLPASASASASVPVPVPVPAAAAPATAPTRRPPSPPAPGSTTAAPASASQPSAQPQPQSSARQQRQRQQQRQRPRSRPRPQSLQLPNAPHQQVAPDQEQEQEREREREGKHDLEPAPAAPLKMWPDQHHQHQQQHQQSASPSPSPSDSPRTDGNDTTVPTQSPTATATSDSADPPTALPAATAAAAAPLSAAAPTRFMQDAIAANAPLVAVTGGLSYVASHVVARMLTKGYFVRAIVPQGASTDFLTRLPGATRRLQLIPVRDPAAEDARATMLVAYRGASTVVHAASFSTHGGKLAKHVSSRRIVNALKLSLDAASTPGNIVTNFIYLSSELTVFDPSSARSPTTAPGGGGNAGSTVHLTENDWFDCSKASRETTHAFAYAHTVAEMRLWARVGRGGLPFNVCSLIPSFVLGPVLSRRHMASTSTIAMFSALASGALHDLPDIPLSPVDVRDVARAVTALTERPEIGGRILLSAEALTAFEFLLRARREFPEYKWPDVHRRHLFRRSTGKGESDALKLLRESELAGRERWGKKYAFSTKRADEELGLSFRPVVDTIRDTLMSLAHYGFVERRPSSFDGPLSAAKAAVSERKLKVPLPTAKTTFLSRRAPTARVALNPNEDPLIPMTPVVEMQRE